MESKQQPPYPLRMPDDLRSRLEASAKQGSRSLNAEIVARLEQSLQHAADLAASDAEDRAASIFARLEILGLREDMVVTRLSSNEMRERIIKADIDRFKAAKDRVRLEEAIAQMEAADAEKAFLRGEQERVAADRAMLQRLMRQMQIEPDSDKQGIRLKAITVANFIDDGDGEKLAMPTGEPEVALVERRRTGPHGQGIGSKPPKKASTKR